MIPEGRVSMLPVTVLLVAVTVTRRSLESLVIAIAVGFMLKDGLSSFPSMMDTVYSVMQDPTIAFVVLLCSVMGPLPLSSTAPGAPGVSATGPLQWFPPDRGFFWGPGS